MERHVELGETVSPGKPLMTGVSLGQLRALVEVPQSFINAIRKHKKARILLLDSNQSISGQSLTIFPYADPVRHAFRVRVELPKNIKNIYPGMLVKVAFTTDTTKRLMIPKTSLVQRSEVSAVYVIDPSGKVKMRQVRTGYMNDENVEILSGLDAGETIAVNPVKAGIALKTQSGDK
jgi:RND family efflux transporter MFP subunit